jgi:hypothetical protein
MVTQNLSDFVFLNYFKVLFFLLFFEQLFIIIKKKDERRRESQFQFSSEHIISMSINILMELLIIIII